LKKPDNKLITKNKIKEPARRNYEEKDKSRPEKNSKNPNKNK